jgi:hypothetical protein
VPRTISDEQYNFYEQARGVAQVAVDLLNDPNLGNEAKALLKRKHPHYRDPEFDIRNEFNKRFDEEKQQREDAERASKDEKTKSEIAAQRKAVQDKYGFTDEGMVELEKFMEEKFVGDYDVAASYKAARAPKAMDATFNDHFWNHEKQKGFAEIAKDPEAWGRSEILGAIQRDQERARGGR